MSVNLDFAILTWALVVNAFCFWLYKTKFANFKIPCTIIALLSGIIIASGWGVFLIGLNVRMFLAYALPNGLLVGFIAVNLYDIFHALQKTGLFDKITALFKGEENV